MSNSNRGVWKGQKQAKLCLLMQIQDLVFEYYCENLNQNNTIRFHTGEWISLRFKTITVSSFCFQYPDSQRPPDEERDRERDRKGKDERPRPKDSSSKEDSKDGTDGSCPPSTEDHRSGGKDPRPNAHIPFSSPLAQHQPYLHYMHGYPFGQSYDPSHPGYRGMSSVMMQNYPGKTNNNNWV